MNIAVNLCVKRYYRVYVAVPDDASDAQIEETAKRLVTNMPTDELETCSDPDLDVEESDIDWIDIDYDSIPALN